MQLVTCLATNASLIADCTSRGREFDPSPVPYTFVEINYEMISMVIFLPSADSFKKSITSKIMCTKYWSTACSSLPVWLGELIVLP